MFGKKKEKSKADIEKSVLEQVALQSIKEQRLKRRWGIFFKLAFLIYFVIILIAFFISSQGDKSSSNLRFDHIGMVKVNGVIASDSNARANYIIRGLKNAFSSKKTKAIILVVNSPGGSPVQSDEVYQEIRYLEKKYPHKKLYAVCTDLCASGGYYIASAAAKIYANKMSIVGSIGVRAGGFGFVDALKKLGISRRLYTSGKDKGFLDPFLPQKHFEINQMNEMLNQTHQVFIDAVVKARGNRLDLKKADIIFSGLPFTGIDAIKYGLIDEFGSVRTLVRNEIKISKVYDYTYKKGFFERMVDQFETKLFYDVLTLLNIRLQ